MRDEWTTEIPVSVLRLRAAVRLREEREQHAEEEAHHRVMLANYRRKMAEGAHWADVGWPPSWPTGERVREWERHLGFLQAVTAPTLTCTREDIAFFGVGE